ncbi:MAG: histidine kinase, partial [Terriglobia bacterium]
RFRRLFNEMLVGCTLNEIICDEHGKPIDRVYLEVNPAFERLTGLRRENIIGRRMREVLPEVEPFWIEKYGQVALTGEPAHFEGYMCAVGKYFDVSVFSPRTGQFAVTFVDITAMKTMEADLRSLLKISGTLVSSLDIVSVIDSLIIEAIKLTNAEGGCSGLRTPDGMVCHKYFRGSEPISFEYCWPPGIGWPGWVLTHKIPYLTNDAPNDPVIAPEIRERFRVKSGIDTPLIDVHGKVIGFFEVNNKKGEARFTHADLQKLTAVSEIASAALQNALAYQKLSETEESLRQLWSRLLQAQEDERRRIGRELHDVTGQVLTAIAMKLGVARRALSVDEGKVREALAEGLALTKQCSDDIRTLSYLLHSPVLEEGGLEAALHSYMESFSQRSGIHIELDIPAELGRLPPEIEVALFRVVQEALTNIHLHSGSSSAGIRVVRNPNGVTLEVKDDGQGIPLEILEKIRTRGVMPGVGIASMQERIQHVGGRLDISSGAQGVIVRITAPLSVEGL